MNLFWGNPGKPKLNSGKGTDGLKHGKQTNTSMWKNQQAQVRTHHKNTTGKFEQQTKK